jgi:rhodanese-related sulfurtransferase
MNLFGIFGQDDKKFGSVTSIELEDIISKKDTLNSLMIIDVRNPDEYNGGHIPGAVLLSIADSSFKDKIDDLDPDLTYYVYCRSGGRSRKACESMAQSGFTKVFNLEKGILEWIGPEEN